ncbi:MAG: UDP-N-acetylmuramate dehydrogenase [Rickettsiales bacterium]|nr:UDP-N-acetylmuramate dehydrogenase [Rickettsiales bacterium]
MTLKEVLENSKCVRRNVKLADINWFRVGGVADYLYKAQNEADLIALLEVLPDGFPLTVLGVGSNIIIKDGGLDGIVLRLGRGFALIEKINEDTIKVGAGALDLSVAKFAQMSAISGFEFLSGIPGTIGGAIKMNAGCYDSEVKDILQEATAYDLHGNKHVFTADELNFSYRKANTKIKNLIFTQAILRGKKGDAEIIAENIKHIQAKRADTQPIKSRTGGSTFKNPDNHKAWELIDKVGMRGFKIGGASISVKHCNFMINDGSATAKDLIELGEKVREKVYQELGVNLEWEIKIIGRDAEN